MQDERGVCALDGCTNALPAPARDERGRLKGGKPVRYCCKAHADEASRRRRALEAVGVEEPLQVLRELGGVTREVVDSALAELMAVRRRWDEVDSAAVARSVVDRAETAAALVKVERAERAADDAERARAEAVVAAVKDRELRVAAERAAEAAVVELGQVRKAAWEQTAEHERARGQAETRAALAEQGQREALDQLAVARREVREVTALQQDTARRLAAAEADRTLAQGQVTSAEERARLAEEMTRQARDETAGAREAAAAARREADTARDDLARAREDCDAIRLEMATVRQDAAKAREETAMVRREAAAARDEATAAHRAEEQARADAAKNQAAYALVLQRLASQDAQIVDLRTQLAAAAERERLLMAAD